MIGGLVYMSRRKSVWVYMLSNKKLPKYHNRTHYFSKVLKRELRKNK